ncbi:MULTISPECIES: hypothetical protein [Agrobacterium tumefaciens complex]|jgi:hypothetical protein|uniref:Lipoprotein n=1 Tax=Agrobacterium radiobacter TaxID=362 RepID=A0ABR6JES5_AGRRD|nr:MULTISPECIES: hypothetical protein [Agrobacterium tumefaciens complex]MBB4283602.1 hypothetical protein [Agrobacterium radiobacter]MBB4321516.1 hypothetical protein [Agrobacterium radiobacter]MBB4325533.1 hypothetical protein [Agrobacterium radiobacter]MBB4338556.1 hypothetical protein [Agrobacterium radiobacter]MBB4408128.1 hypothetical protein [Agrobacterium radiobacter]
MVGAKMTRFLSLCLLLVFAAGCRPTDPQPVATWKGEKIMSATCTNSIITPTERSCKKALLEKCRPGATIANVSETSRPVYRHPGWTTQYVWTALIKNC